MNIQYMNFKIFLWILSFFSFLNLTSCSEEREQFSADSIIKLEEYIQNREDFSYQLEDSLRIDKASISYEIRVKI